MPTSAPSQFATVDTPGDTAVDTAGPTGGEDAPVESPRLRVELARMFGNSPVDGAWWPRSRDLLAEAGELIDNFPPLRGRIDTLDYCPADWDDRPRTVTTSRGPVKVGHSGEEHLVVLSMSSGRRLHLLVVPHTTDNSVAVPIMNRSASSGNNDDATTLLGG